ncbi:MAG: isoleucine--tRNA ligase [Mariprofundaceae bacterium]|nr:isoleucine--tRNA ligase [Mariprofundaceae bacterium]
MSDSSMFDYRSTVFLPKTDFPMRGNLPVREPKMLAQWTEDGLYQQLRETRKNAPRFILHDGPPYANGAIHIGHAVNKVLKDIVIRSRSMMGYDAPYVPGWDCHGLPIELKVEARFKKKKKKLADISDSDFRAACRAYAATQIDIQREDFKRLGILGDWDHPYVTMDYAFEADTVREIGRFLHNGGLYHGAKPVHWCSSCQTALAEAEVEYDNHRSHSIYVKFKAADSLADVDVSLQNADVSVLIWTTTPWTIPANLAIALGAHLAYVAVRITASTQDNLALGEVLIVADGLHADVLHALGAEGEVIAHFNAQSLENKNFRHPYLNQNAPILLGEHVTLEAGTGCVHTAPGHGQEDYVVGMRYGLAVFNPVDHAGVFVSGTPLVAGQHISKANTTVMDHLRDCGALLGHQEISHSYPHCWRCHKPLIFRATPQWFISMEKNKLRSKALEAIKNTAFTPAWGENRIRGMVEQRPDWCVSRQRNWGVPITIMCCDDCGSHAVTTEAVLERIALAVSCHGADVWFSAPLTDFIAEGTVCPDCKGMNFTKERDILDVWFDSGSTHACVLERRDELGSPADLYLEGSDQHRGWFQSSLLESMGTRGHAPFKAVLTHGFVVDAKGNKMSKSVGNVIAPQKIIQQFGADILRLWVASEDYSADIRISDPIIKQLTESYRRIRNTIRFMMGNLVGFDYQRDTMPVSERTPLDQWVMQQLAQLNEHVQQGYKTYAFHRIAHELQGFCTVELGGFYLDVIKDRLYCDASDTLRRRSARASLHDLVNTLIRLIAPILPFTAEEAWQHFSGDTNTSVHMQEFTTINAVAVDDAAWQRLFTLREQVNTALDAAKKDGTIGSSIAANIALPDAADKAWCSTLGEPLAQLLIVANVHVGDSLALAPAEGVKCPRCWNVSTPANTNHDPHNALCSRCYGVVVDG